MKTQRGLIVTMTALALSLLFLCTASAAAQTPNKKVRLVVTVRDSEGNPVGNAKVNVYNEAGPLGGTDTSPEGVAVIIVETTKNFFNARPELSLTIRVVKTDFEPGQDQVDYSGSVPSEITRTITIRKNDIRAGDMTMQVQVLTADDSPVEGAEVVVVENSLLSPRSFSRQTDASGNAAITVSRYGSFEVKVSKLGYPPTSRRVQGVAGPVLVRLGKPVGTIVTISVTNEDNQSGVGDARVVLSGVNVPGGYAQATDASGNATFIIPEKGAFSVTIRQSNYETFTGRQVTLTGEEKQSFAFTLKEKETKEKEDDNSSEAIVVTVLAKDPDDPNAPPKPLAGAWVKVGSVSAPTGADGRVVIRGSYDVTEDVTVTAAGYKMQGQNVAVNRTARADYRRGAATFILEPDLSENSPLRLVVTVLDSATNKPVGDANVLVRLSSRIIGQENTNSNGEAAFTFNNSEDAPLSKLRTGLRLDVAKEKYKIKWSDLTADLLRPSAQPLRPTLFLERDWDELRRQVGALEARVLAWNNDVKQNTSAATNDFIDKALAARKNAEALLKKIEAAREAFGQALVPGAPGEHCGKAVPLQQSIRAAETQAVQKAQELKKVLDEASAAGAKCSTPEEAEAVRSKYRKALQLTADLGRLNKQAVKDRNDLLPLVQKTDGLKNLLCEMLSKLAEIDKQREAAEETASNAADFYQRMAELSRTLMSRQLTLKAELAVLSVKVESEGDAVPADITNKVTSMQSVLAAPNNNLSFGTQQQQELPVSVTSAPGLINSIKASAQKLVSQYGAAACDIDTLDGAVEAIGTEVTGAMIEVSAAADLMKVADDCAKRAATSKDDLVVVEIPEDAVKQPGSPGNVSRPGNRGNDPPEVEEIPESAVKRVPRAGNRNRPGSERAATPEVEEIPEGAVRPSKPKTETAPASADTNTNTPPPGVRPCTEDEKAAFQKMSGSFKSYRMNITIGGSCEQVTGTYKVTEWCEGVDETGNPNTPRVTGTFKGRMNGGSLSVTYEQPASPNSPARKGSGSCSLSSDGTFSCSGFGCPSEFKRQ